MSDQTYMLRLYRDKQKQYRWQLKSANGRVVADSAEAYKRAAGITGTLSKFAAGWKPGHLKMVVEHSAWPACSAYILTCPVLRTIPIIQMVKRPKAVKAVPQQSLFLDEPSMKVG